MMPEYDGENETIMELQMRTILLDKVKSVTHIPIVLNKESKKLVKSILKQIGG